MTLHFILVGVYFILMAILYPLGVHFYKKFDGGKNE